MGPEGPPHIRLVPKGLPRGQALRVRRGRSARRSKKISASSRWTRSLASSVLAARALSTARVWSHNRLAQAGNPIRCPVSHSAPTQPTLLSLMTLKALASKLRDFLTCGPLHGSERPHCPRSVVSVSPSRAATTARSGSLAAVRAPVVQRQRQWSQTPSSVGSNPTRGTDVMSQDIPDGRTQ